MAEPMGFYTDTTVCIGCKACEVACKEWNQLPSTNGGVNTLSGDSYDNTRQLDGIHWRHVKSGLHRGLSIRRYRHQPGVGNGPEMYPVL